MSFMKGVGSAGAGIKSRPGKLCNVNKHDAAF